MSGPRTWARWPDSGDVTKELHNQDASNKVYTVRPSSTTDIPNPQDIQNIILYTDINDKIIVIPTRGALHDNRLAPGWKELEGKPLEYAKKVILDEVIGVTVEWYRELPAPPSQPVLDRVRIAFNEDTGSGDLVVAGIPKIG